MRTPFPAGRASMTVNICQRIIASIKQPSLEVGHRSKLTPSKQMWLHRLPLKNNTMESRPVNVLPVVTTGKYPTVIAAPNLSNATPALNGYPATVRNMSKDDICAVPGQMATGICRTTLERAYDRSSSFLTLTKRWRLYLNY